MFTGSIVALVTPMHANGEVDQNSLKKLVEYHINSGTAGIVSVGTTGESATLNHHEHADVVKMTLDFADGRIPIIAGTGANSTAEAISLTKSLDRTGIVACLSVTPYYNKPTQEGLFQHFKAIAEHTEIPQILYNVPGRTGCDLLPETIARLAEIENIVGIKDATGNLSRVSQMQTLISSEFCYLSGDDATSLDFLQLGGHGVISVTANIAAKEMVELCLLAKEQQFAQARILNQRLMPLHRNLFIESNPIPVKWACKRLELIASDVMRLPMTTLSNSAQPIVEKALKQAGLL